MRRLVEIARNVEWMLDAARLEAKLGGNLEQRSIERIGGGRWEYVAGGAAV